MLTAAHLLTPGVLRPPLSNMFLSRAQAAQKRAELAASGALTEEQHAEHDKQVAFLAACERGDAPAVEAALKADTLFATLVHAADASGASGLALAAKRGHTEVMELLLRYGSSVNGHDDTRPPLCWAADAGHLEACRLLLTRETGARAAVNHRDPFGFTALLDAAKAGRADMCRFLLQHKADVNFATPSGQTSLHFAAQNNCMPVVTALLEHGADPSLRTEGGFTAEALAGLANHIEMVRFCSPPSISLPLGPTQHFLNHAHAPHLRALLGLVFEQACQGGGRGEPAPTPAARPAGSASAAAQSPSPMQATTGTGGAARALSPMAASPAQALAAAPVAAQALALAAAGGSAAAQPSLSSILQGGGSGRG